MYIYIFEMLFVLSAGGLLYSKRISKKSFLIICFFLMSIVLGLRGENVGEDTLHYIEVFEKTNNLSWKTLLTSGTDVVYETVWNVNRSMEVGYLLLNKIIGIFTDNGQWLLILVAFITYFFMAKFVYDNCKDVFFPTYIILCESFYMQSFNLARQALAISIGLQAYTLLKKNNKYSIINAIITIFIAFLFHKSAIVLFFLIPIWLIKDNRKWLKLILLGSGFLPLFVIFFSKIILIAIPRYASYLENNYWENSVGGIIILWIIEIFMIIYIFKKYNNNDGKEIFITTVLTALYLSLEFIGLKFTVFSRITLYFRIFLIFLFPYFTKYIRPNSRLLYRTGMIVLLSIFFLRYASTPVRIYYFFWQLGG